MSGPRSASRIRHPESTGMWWCTRGRTCRGRTPPTCSAETSSKAAMTPDEEAGEPAEVIELPAAPRAVDIALDELELVYAFIYARVGNRADAEDLTQQVAMTAPPDSPSEDRSGTVSAILAELSDNYRRVLELRFLHGYSLKEVAAEMNSTVGAIKVMQLRALRAAAKVRRLE